MPASQAQDSLCHFAGFLITFLTGSGAGRYALPAALRGRRGLTTRRHTSPKTTALARVFLFARPIFMVGRVDLPQGRPVLCAGCSESARPAAQFGSLPDGGGCFTQSTQVQHV